MIHAPLDKIDETLLQSLCANRTPETSTLDFKRELPGTAERDRVELQKDVSALANSEGGDLVFGIAESSGGASAIFPITSSTPDDSKRRLIQIIEGLEPRVHGLQVRHIDVVGGYVLVVRVPASFNGPHSVRANDARRFVLRNGPKTTDMTYDQLRSAFDRTSTLADRADGKIVDRVHAIVGGRGRRPLHEGAVCAFNAVPLSGLAGMHAVNVAELYSSDSWHTFMHNGWGGADRSTNLDGLLITQGGPAKDPHEGYTQVFRDGGMEAVARVGRPDFNIGGVNRRIVFSDDLARFCRAQIQRFLQSMSSWGFSGPALLNWSLLHVDEYEMGMEQQWYRFNRAFVDRPHLLPPNVFVPSVESADADEILRPQLDMLWQAFDINGCTAYDENGQWRLKR